MSSDALPMVFAKHAVKFVRPDQAVVAEPVKVKKPRAKKEEAAPAPEVAAPAPETPKVKKVKKAKIAPAPDTSAITPMTAPPALEADVPAPVKAKKQKKVKAPAVVAAVPALPSEPAAKPAKKKRAPTAYNIAVGLHMKAGKTMKEAAALAKAEKTKSA